MSQTKKHKILMLGDHPLSSSGVGTQSQMLIKGLIDTGKYTFRCLGGAIKHNNYETQVPHPDLIIKPIDGFGNKEMLRDLLVTEQPDCILLFTDPRQFTWVWEMEDEINQVCPIAYWTIWDNDPYPALNKPWYDSTELLNCISKKTYGLISPHYPDKTNYIPHAFPEQVFFPLPEEQIKVLRQQNFGDRKDWFVALWVNRNATRKMPADLMISWKMFLDNLQEKHGHKNALLIMHTDPMDAEGPNLLAVNELLGCGDRITFSVDKIGFDLMNVLHNMADCTVNISKAEGFGLSILSSLMVAKPVVALKTGGMVEQVIDPDTGEEMGVAIEPCHRSLVGSQLVPYIYEDFASHKDIANAFMKLHELDKEERKELGQKALAHARKHFSYQKMIGEWDRTLQELIAKGKPAQWEMSTITLRGTK